MNGKKFLLVLATTLLAIVNTSFGAWCHWEDNDPCSNSWLDPNEWSTGTVPVTGDGARFGQNIMPDDQRVVVDGVTPDVSQIRLAEFGDSTITIVPGGILNNLAGWTGVGADDSITGAPYTGEIIMEGGEFNVGGNLSLGWDGGTGILTMNDGVANIMTQNLYIPWTSGSGTLNLNGGEVNVWTLDMEDNGGLIDIKGGALRVHNFNGFGGTFEGYVGAGKIVAYGDNPRAQFIVEDVVLGDGATYTSVTAFLPDANQAWNPFPTNAASLEGDQIDAVTLSWSPGDNVKSTNGHHVYFGYDFDDVNDANTSDTAIYQGAQDGNTFDPGTLDMDETYYWRVDQENTDSSVTKGNVWQFEIENYITVDNFESYTDDTSLQAAWTGASSLETVTVQQGDNSMKCDFTQPVTRTFASPQDWQQGSVEALALYFHGATHNPAEVINVTLEDSSQNAATVYYDDPNDLVQMTLGNIWTQWNIDLGDFVDINGVNLSQISKITIGAGDGVNPVSSGIFFVDDIRLYGPRCIGGDYLPAGDFTGDCDIDIEDLDELHQGWLLSDYTVNAEEPDNTLLAYYPFDEGSGTVAEDYSTGDPCDPNAHNGTINGTASWVTGMVNTGLDFDGSSTYVSVPDSIGNFNAVTISTWIKLQDVDTADETIFAQPWTEGSIHFNFSINAQAKFGVKGASNYRSVVSSPLNVDQWYHVAITYSGSSNLVLNGDFEAVNSLENWHYADPGVRAVSDNGPSAAGDTAIEIDPSKDLRSYTFPASEGVEYTATWDYIAEGSNRPNVRLRFFDASGTYISQVNWNFPNSGTWRSLPYGDLSAVAPTGTASADIVFKCGTGPEKLYIDNVFVDGGTSDSGTFRAYVNGILDNETQFDDAAAQAFIGPFEIGSYNAGRLLDGTLDELRIYGGALTHEEIVYLAEGSGQQIIQPLDTIVDINEDGKVDMYDFAGMASNWLVEDMFWPFN